jgi:hypothetical protein
VDAKDPNGRPFGSFAWKALIVVKAGLRRLFFIKKNAASRAYCGAPARRAGKIHNTKAWGTACLFSEFLPGVPVMSFISSMWVQIVIK